MNNTSVNIFLKIFLLVTLFTSCGDSDTRNRSNNEHLLTSENNGIPKIEFLSEIHNFGTLKAGEIISFSFRFSNNGTGSLKIKKIETSCGCIKTKFENSEILPGEISFVEVILNTSGEWGNLLKTIEVETSTGEKKIITIGAYIESEQFNNLLKTEK